MVKRDLREIAVIEHDSFEYPWLNCDFREKLDEDGFLCYVVEHDGMVVAYVVVKYFQDHIEINNIAVHPHYRRHKIGTLIIDMLKIKLGCEGRGYISAYLNECNLGSQLFFKKNGFVADGVIERYFADGRDAYFMCFDPRDNSCV
jgi:ribosomal-protein-alanine N-acetyltransferase